MRKTGLILLAIVFFTACSKKANDPGPEVCLEIRPTGTLTGVDDRKCACCGGVYLIIDGHPGQFRALELPSMTQDELRSLNFPRRIEFSVRKTGKCGDDELVEVLSYRLLP